MDVRESRQIMSLTFKNSQDAKKRECVLRWDTELAMGWLLGRMFLSL